MKVLEDKIRRLGPEEQKAVEDFVESLRKRRKGKSRRKIQFKWAGALRDLRDQYTSVELQHQIWNWVLDKK